MSAKRVLQSEWKHEGIPFYRAREIVKLSSNGYVDNDLFISNDHYQTLKDAFGVPQAGDIMLSAVGTIGKTYIVKKEDCFYYKDASVLCLRNVHNVNAQFLDLILQTPLLQKQMTAQSKGTTVETITIERALLYLLPIPPREEQIRIVNSTNQILNLLERINLESSQLGKAVSEAKNYILKLAISGKLVLQDSSDEPAIELLKRINPDYKPCDNSHYRDLPKGWSMCTLYDICDTINGLWKGKNPPFVNVGVIRNANFTKDFNLDYSKIEYIDVEQRAFEKRNLEDGDLIVEKSGGSDNFPVGRSILYQGESGKYSFSNFTMALRIKDKNLIRSRYLYFVILHKYVSGEMRHMQTQTTGLHNLLSDKYMSMSIPIPPTKEQDRIIDSIEKLLNQMNKIKTVL